MAYEKKLPWAENWLYGDSAKKSESAFEVPRAAFGNIRNAPYSQLRKKPIRNPWGDSYENCAAILRHET